MHGELVTPVLAVGMRGTKEDRFYMETSPPAISQSSALLHLYRFLLCWQENYLAIGTDPSLHSGGKQACSGCGVK